jgi:hypothetical protein
MQALVKHSQDKDQFLKVVIKRMAQTQSFEDEHKEVSELNSILLARYLRVGRSAGQRDPSE